MNEIIVLDNLTIKKIAAGEIIERPSSIVKELVENSLDANAQNIFIEIENGGKSLIRITDDGDGISKSNLQLAFKRHSTSKLQSMEDLYNVLSLGFRGEALASISSVAKVEVLTKTNDSSAGIQAIVEDGEIKSMDIIGCPKGTTMIIRDLFYNLPVRKKFLKNNLSESNHITDLVYKLALGNPQVSFVLIKDKKTILKTSRSKELINTIHTVLGREYSKNMFPINHKDDYLTLEGFLSNNIFYRGNRNHQYIFVNKRYILSNSISRVIENNYKTLIPIGKYPVFVLNIEIKPSEIDINIHPTKQEIKFINQELVYQTINSLVEDNIKSILRIPKVVLNRESSTHKKEDLPLLYMNKSKQTLNNEILNYNNDIKFKTIISSDPGHSLGQITHKNSSDIDDFNFNLVKEDQDDKIVEDNLLNQDEMQIIPLGIIFTTYIIAEVKGQNKIIFIDQHAAHERVMYEKYKKQYENEEIYSQILIAPDIIEMTTSEINQFNENIDLFYKLGFEIENFGPNSIAIRSVPLIFGQPKLSSLFLDIMDSLDMNLSSSYETKIDKIMKIACTSAIKSGDKIEELEIGTLYRDLMTCEYPYTCPHGRPTLIELTKKDIEKQFLRIV